MKKHPSFAPRLRSGYRLALRPVLALLTVCLPVLATAQLPTPEPTASPAGTPIPPRTSFINGYGWPDTNGEHINAHGGTVISHDGTFYWYGEARNPRGSGLPPSRGIACYSSKDLYNWKNEGLVLPVVDDETSDIASGCIIERPKVVYNAGTKKFVMWFHLELKGRGYGAARAAVAVGDSPTGPFQFIRSLRPNAGIWPVEFPASSRTALTAEQAKEKMSKMRDGIAKGMYTRRDFEGGQMSRDMTVFVDDDGKAYLVSSAEENYTLDVHELTPDYLDFTGKWTRVMPGGHNEAPTILKKDRKYYLLASGCTGWAPNDARVFVSSSIWGPWKNAGNPCTGGSNPVTRMGPDKTFGGQSTALIPVPGKSNSWIAMFDVWRPQSLLESGHIWLPVTFKGDRMVIPWNDKWDLTAFR